MPRTPPSPITDADRQRVRELHSQGLGRNDIAKAIGRSASTVTKLAGELGLSFSRAATQAATDAKVADARARRADLALDLLADAERLRRELWEPCKAFNFGGRDNTYNEVQLDQPTFADKLKIMQAAATAVDKALRLDDHDSGDTGTVGSLLGSLFDRMQATHGTGDDA